MEEGFEGLETMDLESAGADFDSVIPTSKTIQPEPSTSSNTSESALSVSRTLNPSTASVEATLSTPPPHSRATTPIPSPATRSRPNTPPISPTRSIFNSPACSPTRTHVNSVVPLSPPEPSLISPTHSPVNSAAIPSTRSHVNELPISLPEPPILAPDRGDCHAAMDSEPPTAEIGSKRGGPAATSTKRGREVEKDAPSKRTRHSNTDAAIASDRTTRLAAATSVAARRGLRGDKAATPAAERRSKTVRTSAPSPTGSPSAIAHVEAEKNPPPWFSRTVVMLQSESAMGEEWMELVRVWASFEVRSRYQEVSKLGPTDRPSAVGEWIGRARSSTWRPVIGNLATYESAFWKWWSGIQPDWRVEDGKLVRECLGGDWEPLQRPGTNGIVSVMVALFYWGLVIVEKGHGRDGWLSAVEDCCAAFRQL